MHITVTTVVNKVEVSSPTETVYVNVPSYVVNVAASGPQGIPGPVGPSGGSNRNYSEVMGTYYLTLSDDDLGVNASNGDCTITLRESTALNKGYKYGIKMLDSTSYTVTVSTQLGQPMDGGSTTYVLDFHNDYYEFYSTGSGYQIH